MLQSSHTMLLKIMKILSLTFVSVVDFLSSPMFSSFSYILVPQLVWSGFTALVLLETFLTPCSQALTSAPSLMSSSSSHIATQQSGSGNCCESTWEAGRLSFTSGQLPSIVCCVDASTGLPGSREGVRAV